MLAYTWTVALFFGMFPTAGILSDAVYSPGTHHCSPSWELRAFQTISAVYFFGITLPVLTVCYVLVFRAIRQSKLRLKSRSLRKDEGSKDDDVTGRRNECTAESRVGSETENLEPVQGLDPTQLDRVIPSAEVYSGSAVQRQNTSLKTEESAPGGAATDSSAPNFQLSITQETHSFDSTSCRSATQDGISIEACCREENISCELESAMQKSAKKKEKKSQELKHIKTLSMEKQVALTGGLSYNHSCGLTLSSRNEMLHIFCIKTTINRFYVFTFHLNASILFLVIRAT